MDKISRNGVAWILAVHGIAIVPHLAHLEFWLIGMTLGCLGWRWLVYYFRMPLPSRILRFSLVAIGGLAIIFEYSGRISSEAGIALLVMSASLKLLELKKRRDAYLQIVLGYFLLATGFLFHSELWFFVYVSIVVCLITAALVSLQNTSASSSVIRPMKNAVKMCAQALPITILLFVFFPRMMPIWSLSLSKPSQPPSLSNSMTPSEISNLAGKSDLAFRATFENAIPERKELYWRALVFTHFDGERWSAWSSQKKNRHVASPVLTDDINYLGRPYRYTVMMQPTLQNYLIALDMPKRLIMTDQTYKGGLDKGTLLSVSMYPDYRLIASRHLDKVTQYGVESYLTYRAGEQLEKNLQLKALQLPRNTNLKTQALAQEWYEEVQGDQDRYVQRVLGYFRDKPFYYTLKPPIFDQNTVDGFLFDSRQGYCAHYAGAFVFLLRAAGIPARVVGGYMGGEVNWIGQFVSVYQYEAHAWAEAWLPGRGWVRFDPTAEVAPERILDSIESLLDLQQKEGQTDRFFSTLSRPGNPIFKGVRHVSDYANYMWYRKVVGFDAESQKRMLKNYFNDLPAHFFIVVIVSLFTLIGVLCLMLQRRSVAGLSKMDLQYRAFQSCLHRYGVDMLPGETPGHFQRRAQQLLPEASDLIHHFTQLYMSHQYQPPSNHSEPEHLALRSMRKDLKMLSALLIKRRFEKASKKSTDPI